MRYFAQQYLEHLHEIENAANAPEPMPEHRAAVEALLRARGVLGDTAGHDEQTEAQNNA
jgi:hypothetical protein